jgi:SNF2 family DNA or RNA helicase
MINKQAVNRFLARKLASYEWIKKIKQQELDAELAAMGADKATSKLWQHQKQCLILLHELKRFMLFVDMGGGKTLTTLSLMRHCKQQGEPLRAIVFVPFITSVETWVEQVAEHAPDLHIVPLTGSKEQNRYRLSLKGDLFVMCYQSAVAMLSKKRKNRKGKNKWTFEAKDVRDTFAGFNMLIMDEVHKCKNVGSLTYRMCRALSAAADYSIGLTGTPFGRDPLDLWSQFYLVDFGETLGPTLGFFRDVFYTGKPGFFGGFDYKFKRKLMPVLNKTVQNCSISYGIDDLIDMPPKRYVKTPLNVTDESKGYVDNAVKLLRDAQKDNNLQEIESNYLKLRQLASGFMTLRGEDKERVHLQFNDNPKLDALEEIIDGMPPDRKVVIFHHFVYTNQLISDRLKAMKVKHARIYGKSRDPISELRRFKQDVACRALVINSRSGSSSLNLQGANYLVFFEQPDSPIDRQQAERRVWRPGQKWRVLIYDLLMKGTSDVTLYHSNRAGESLLKELLRGKAMT